MIQDSYRTPIIFMYHSVRPAENGGPYGIEIAPDRFARHIAFISAHYRVVPLIEFVEALSSRARTDGMAAITFDDAFRRQPDRRRRHPPQICGAGDGVRTDRLHWSELLLVGRAAAVLDGGADATS